MKLARVGVVGKERPVVLGAGGRLLDARSIVGDWAGSALEPEQLAQLAAAVEAGTLEQISEEGIRFGPCVGQPGKIVCAGLNYRDHAAESNAPVPEEPVLFLKAGDTVVGSADDVLIPRGSSKTDWEVELAVIIGATARYLGDPAEAPSVIAGYAVSNEVSERAFQSERGGLWDKGKSCETFYPLGPWLVTQDEVPDPQALRLRTWVDGKLRQDSSTADMIFGVNHLVWYVSQFMVLRPGDVISTGTPAGVALGQPEPKPYLRPGSVVECEIEGLGRTRNVFKSEPGSAAG